MGAAYSRKFLKCVDPNPYYQRWLYQGILLTEPFPKFGYEGNNQREFVCDADAESLYPSHSHRVTFGHIELHLPIGFPLP